MRTRAFLGREVSVIAMGTVPLGSAIGEAESFDMLDAYRELGGSFIDLARAYGNGAAEKTVGKWLRKTGFRGLVATKGGLPGKDGAPRLDRESLAGDLNASLEALGAEKIELYWLHRDDPARPVEDMLDTLNRFAQEGKIAHFGASNWTWQRLEEARNCALTHGYQGFSASQPQWSLARMEIFEDPTLVQMDGEARAWHRETGLPCVCFSSQAKGFFQKLELGGEAALSDKAKRRYLSARNLRAYEAAKEIGRELGLSVGAVALGYLTSQLFPVFPIAGASGVKQVRAIQEAQLPGWAVEKLDESLEER